MNRDRKAATEQETWAKLWPSQHAEKSVPTSQGAAYSDARRRAERGFAPEAKSGCASDAIDCVPRWICVEGAGRPVLADVGAGKSDLGFILYDLVFGPAGRGSVVGIEASGKACRIVAFTVADVRLRAHAVHRITIADSNDPRRLRRHSDGAPRLRHVATDDDRFALRHEAKTIALRVLLSGRSRATLLEEPRRTAATTVSPSYPAP